MKRAIIIITGILTVILGVYAMCVPFRTFLGLGWILGALLLSNGVELIATSRKSIGQIILGAVIGIGGAVILFNGAQRLLTDVILAYVAGASVMIYGLNLLMRGVRVVRFNTGAGILSILSGVLSIIAGIFAVGHPFMTMISVGYIIAFNIIMHGINMAVLGTVVKLPGKQE